MSASEEKTELQIFLDAVLAEAEKAANEKVTKAMRLFIQCDGMYKRIVLHGIGFTGPVTAPRLREAFDTMDLLDAIDDLISDMEDDIEHNQRGKPASKDVE